MNLQESSQTALIKTIDETNEFHWNIRGIPPKGIDPYQEGLMLLEKSRSINYLFGQAQSLLNLSMGSFILKNDSDLAMSQITEAIQLFKDMKNDRWIANSHVTISIIFNSTGKSEAALSNALRGIGYFEKNTDDTNDKSMAYYVLGTVYKDLKKYNEAEKSFKAGISENPVNASLWSGRIYSGLSNIYSYQEKYDDAISMGFKALDILKNESNSIGESRALNDIGAIYKKQKNTPKHWIIS